MKRYMLNLSLLVAASTMAKSAHPYAFKDRMVPVGVHGVNYSDATFSYTVRDPQDESNAAGGEILSAYSAGGTMCCYSLPRTWKPGIVVDVKVSSWPKVPKGEKAEEVRETFSVEVPEYKEVGELWVLRLADGKVALVSSNVGPTHERWAGPVKGWPVPSLEFRRELWAKKLAQANEELENALEFKRELSEKTASIAKRRWEFYFRKMPDRIAGLSGPEDPRFLKKLDESSSERIESAKKEIRTIEGVKP